MRLLFVSNFYPPANFGGYELWCQEIATTFRQNGHDVIVLTSLHRQEQVNDEGWIYRELHLEMALTNLWNGVLFFSRAKRERHNLGIFADLAQTFKPDAILFWGMWNLTRALPAYAESLYPQKSVYYIGDYWLTQPSQTHNYWQAPASHWYTALPKALLKKIAFRQLAKEENRSLTLPHALFASQFMQATLAKKGIRPQRGQVIYGAIDTKPYLQIGENRDTDAIQNLLFVGRLASHKGVDTAIKAIHHLRNEKVQLQIVGDGEQSYVAYLHSLVKRWKLENYVHFWGWQPKEKMPGIYAQADAFLFTSRWPEPFGRVLVEAMASGLLVVGAGVGGSAEILEDAKNALLFPSGDALALAEKIICLKQNAHLRRRLRASGIQSSRNIFNKERMTQEIETYLLEHVL